MSFLKGRLNKSSKLCRSVPRKNHLDLTCLLIIHFEYYYMVLLQKCRLEECLLSTKLHLELADLNEIEYKLLVSSNQNKKKLKVSWHLPPSASQIRKRSIPSSKGPTTSFNLWPWVSVIITFWGGTVKKMKMHKIIQSQ